MIEDGSSTGECDVAHAERGTILFCPCVLAGAQEEKICNDDHVAYTLCFFIVCGKGHRRHFPEHNDGDRLYSVGGTVLIRVASELETEADVNISVLPVPGVDNPQCRERLANRPYGILSRAGLYWTDGWGDVPRPVVPGEDVKDGDRVFVTDK